VFENKEAKKFRCSHCMKGIMGQAEAFSEASLDICASF
jgi:hypothetical protein